MRRNPYWQHLYVVKADAEPALRNWALSLLIEDRVDRTSSYSQFLSLVKDKVRALGWPSIVGLDLTPPIHTGQWIMKVDGLASKRRSSVTSFPCINEPVPLPHRQTTIHHVIKDLDSG